MNRRALTLCLALASSMGAGCVGCTWLQPRASACDDGRVNGHETDLDCGGRSCAPCVDGKICLANSDCASGQCTQYRCQAPSCTDARRNADETDVDCGGAGCPACRAGKACGRAADCASGQCVDGQCAGVDAGVSCAAPLAQCGSDCVDPRVDRGNCGACGVVCSGDAICAAGQCGVMCLGGNQQCGAACVDVASNPTHCGGCNQPCATGSICVGGACVIPCPLGQVPCSGVCVSLDRDPANCGGCGLPCAAGSACVMGQCSAGCGAPLLMCNSGTTCVDPQNDPDHCGGCMTNCTQPPNALRACRTGACALGLCAPGFDDCNGQVPDGCEAQLSTNPLHCGACGRACTPLPNATTLCADGGCAVGVCQPGFDNCNGQAPDGCEVQLSTNPLHCGACNASCMSLPNASASTCADGGCVVGACQPGFGDCNVSPGDGCETTTSTSLAHCGACNNACTNGPFVAASMCFDGGCEVAACTSFFRDDCNGDPVDGCETILVTDNNNCGFCGNVCPMGDMCTPSGCCSPTMPPGAYSSTCSNCQFCNGLLTCQCTDNMMMLSLPSSVFPSMCTSDILNCDGVLTCDAC